MNEESKETMAGDKREALIREKMRLGNMTRENAELVVETQAAEDAQRAKKARK